MDDQERELAKALARVLVADFKRQERNGPPAPRPSKNDDWICIEGPTPASPDGKIVTKHFVLSKKTTEPKTGG